jgi:tetratricopeptide (TPR) repeat protein
MPDSRTSEQPDERAELLQRAHQHYAAGEYEQELALADQVIQIDPAWPGGYWYRSSALAHLGRYPEAEVSLRTQIRLDPHDAAPRILLATVRYVQGDAGEAESTLSSLLNERLDPVLEVKARSDLARLFARSDRAAEALSQIDPALDLAEHEVIPVLTAQIPVLLHMKGQVLFHLGRIREAARTMARLVELRPDNARDWYNLACAYSRLEKAHEALDALRRAVSLKPELSEDVGTDQDFEFLRTAHAEPFAEAVALSDPAAVARPPGSESDEIRDFVDGLTRERRIFVSYRRADAADAAAALKERVEAREAAARVFVDVESLEPGRGFPGQLSKEISDAELVIVLVSPYWHTREGRERINDPDDFVHREVAWALANRTALIPVLVETNRMPVPEALPEDVRELTTIHALPLRSAQAESDLEGLTSTIQRLMDERVARLEKVLESSDMAGARIEYIGAPIPPTYRVPSSGGLGVPPDSVEQWYGVWECRTAGRGAEIILRFEPDPRRSGHFTGTYAERAGRFRRPDEQEISGNWGKVITDDMHQLAGVYLEYVIGSASRTALLPFHRRVGDAFVGTDLEGREYVTRNIRPLREGF